MGIKEALELAINILNQIPNRKVNQGMTYDIIPQLEKAIENDSWVCTDPDNNQFGRQISEKKFEFKEKDFHKDEFKMTIDLNQYSEEEMFYHVSSYYSREQFKKILNNKDYWIIAECIFEQESGLY